MEDRAVYVPGTEIEDDRVNLAEMRKLAATAGMEMPNMLRALDALVALVAVVDEYLGTAEAAPSVRSCYPTFNGYCMSCGRRAEPVHHQGGCDMEGVEDRFPLLVMAMGYSRENQRLQMAGEVAR